MNMARFISFWVGFASLSLEIAWVRLYGYANSSTPQAFAYVLMVYLLGIAFGAQVGKRICQTSSYKKIERTSLLVLCISAPIAVASPWIYLHSQGLALDGILAPFAVFVTAASLSVLFPITHHLGTPKDSIAAITAKGKHFSHVYVLNVTGAALGPLVTGYILLEHLTITQIFPTLATLIALIALIAWALTGSTRKIPTLVAATAALTVSLWSLHYSLQTPDALVRSFALVGGHKVIATHENRHGIITIAEDYPTKRFGESFIDHLVYGGNVYDGKVNVSLERNTNGLERPLALHVLQPKAKNVLILGLSIGSWLTVVEGFPGVEAIDVIEINPGYLEMAKSYSPQKRALEDPRVTMVIDDARRWLQYHPDRKYDLILMNTTWHWRANSSMLLSKEMMELARRHLSDQGVLAFNATGSVDAFYTVTKVFKEVRRYQNFIYAADWNPFDNASQPEAWKRLSNVTIDGSPGFRQNSVKIVEYSKIPFSAIEKDLKQLNRPPELITDDNMLVEYKYGRKL